MSTPCFEVRTNYYNFFYFFQQVLIQMGDGLPGFFPSFPPSFFILSDIQKRIFLFFQDMGKGGGGETAAR
jgi:hypothetical protein